MMMPSAFGVKLGRSVAGSGSRISGMALLFTRGKTTLWT